MKTTSTGFGLLEIVVGAAILTLVSLGAMAIFGNLVRLSHETTRATQGAFLLQEGAEVLRLWRDQGWNNIANLSEGTDYYFVFDGTKWATSTSPAPVDGVFERKFRTSAVYRDVQDDIAPAGDLDDNTRGIELQVSWGAGGTLTTRSLNMYLTNLFE